MELIAFSLKTKFEISQIEFRTKLMQVGAGDSHDVSY